MDTTAIQRVLIVPDLATLLHSGRDHRSCGAAELAAIDVDGG